MLSLCGSLEGCCAGYKVDVTQYEENI